MTVRDIVREAKILDLRARGYTLAEIGKLYDISRERVRQIIVKATKPRNGEIINDNQ